MIFAKTADLILAGKKRQTLRKQYFGDRIGADPRGRFAILELNGRPRWIVWHTYAVQRERCHPAIARIRVTSLHEVRDPLAAFADPAFARLEGFDSPEEALKVWRELHGSKVSEPCWAIGFELVK